ncbi:MAG: response regulator [Anaerolineae bacterium]|nr:response regulator [Anaerolineae bacterium]
MSKSPAQSDSKKNVIKVLIVDDIPETRENLKKLLAFEPDIEVVGTASTGREGLDLSKELLPDIVLMDINMPDMNGIDATQAINKVVPTANVIMMSVQSEADYLRKALQAGARDFLTKPISGEELYGTIRNVYDRRPQMVVPVPQPGGGSPSQKLQRADRAHVIVVYSPQGGAGKTTVATNVAASLMREGTKVLLMDCDLQFGDVGVFLNLQSQNTLVDLVRSVDDLDMDLVENVMVSHESGLKVLLGPPRPEDAEEILADKVALLVEKLKGAFDFIVVDLASKLDELAIALFDTAERIVLVINPTLPAVKNVRIILDLMTQLQYPEGKSLLVINKVTAELERAKAAIPVEAIEKNLKRKSIGIIPMDERRVLAAINRGITVVARDRNVSPAKDLIALADAVRSSVMPEEQPQAQPQADMKQSRLSGFMGRR